MRVCVCVCSSQTQATRASYTLPKLFSREPALRGNTCQTRPGSPLLHCLYVWHLVGIAKFDASLILPTTYIFSILIYDFRT